MKDYKRLTKRDIEGTYVNTYELANEVKKWQEKHGLYDYIGTDATQILLERLADLEDKIENGTLVELPCKVGQPIWIICYELWTTKPFVDESFIKSFVQIAMIMEHGEIGKTVFLTKAEAEAKLRELKGEQQ